jgi:hypothetical protein
MLYVRTGSLDLNLEKRGDQSLLFLRDWGKSNQIRSQSSININPKESKRLVFSVRKKIVRITFDVCW